MQKTIWRALAALVALVVFSASAWAQFETDHSYIGPHLGLGSYESALSFGGDFEYAVTKPGEAGPGRIGVGATVDYWSWSGGSAYDYYWSYTWVPVNVFCAYHYPLHNRKWDLFAGLGLGYIVVNATWHRPDGGIIDESPVAYSSSLYWNGIAGVRYFFSPALALNARLGWGGSVLSVGVDLGL